MAMIRQRRVLAQAVPTALILSARTAEDVLFSEELHSIESNDPAFVLALAITRQRPAENRILRDESIAPLSGSFNPASPSAHASLRLRV
jgi:ferredoxin-NADP reductase